MAMPTDNGKDYFVNEFYKRTIQILDNCHTEYDVALAINCMVGLLIVPKERYFKSKAVPDTLVEAQILSQIYGQFQNLEKQSLTQVLRHLRNAVAHGDMEIRAEEPVINGQPMKIGTIVFKDDNNVSAEIPVTLLKTFLVDFATNLCKQIEQDG